MQRSAGPLTGPPRRGARCKRKFGDPYVGKWACSSGGELPLCKRSVVGSNPTGSTTCLPSMALYDLIFSFGVQNMEGRACTRCGLSKPAEDFGLRKATGKLQSWCKLCYRELHRIRWSENVQGRKEYQAYKNRELRDRNVNYVFEFLSANPCMDCGEADPVTLEFDHRPGEKSYLPFPISAAEDMACPPSSQRLLSVMSDAPTVTGA